MSTHVTKCVVCGEKCYCCNDEHALGCGEGCSNLQHTIEFCSVECFHDLEKRMAERWKIYQEVIGEGL